jgi:hypothetical protein
MKVVINQIPVFCSSKTILELSYGGELAILNVARIKAC